ncbi:MAG: hypothetical protein K6F64_02740 [Clostridia bacterium]|nr:hypothetical protein [Clostridia bacterium]
MEELVCDSLFDVYDEDFIRNLVNEVESLDRSEIDKPVKRILKENHSSDENFGNPQSISG